LGWRGIKRESDTKQAILDFLNEKKEAGFTEIADYCGKKGISRMTVKKYLDQLKREGLVRQSLEGRHPYSITKKGIEYVLRETTKLEINKELDNISLQELKMFNKLLVERWLSKALVAFKRNKKIHVYLLGSNVQYRGSVAPLILYSFHKPPDSLPTIEEALKMIEEIEEKLERPKPI